jgi:predicted  nucleic acid-binding Zn-ribbon protein
MSDNTTNQKQLNQELQNLIDDTRMVLKTIEVKREEIAEGVTAEIEQLKLATKALKQENVSLQSMPKKLATKVQELLPNIVEQLERISEKTNQDFAKNANITMQQNNIAVKEIASEFKTLKQDFDGFDRQRTKRYFRGFGII